MSLLGFGMLWLAVYLTIASMTKNKLKIRFIITALVSAPLAMLVFWKTFEAYLISL